jgi:hypothetical protein
METTTVHPVAQAPSVPSGFVLTPRPKSRRPLIFGFIVLIILILAAAGYATYRYTSFGSSVRAAWAISSMSSELKGVTFLADGLDGTTMYTIKGYSFVPVKLNGTLISLEKNGDKIAEIVLDTKNMYHVTIDGTEVYASSTPLLGISVAPDRNSFVVSAKSSPKESVPEHIYFAANQVHPFYWNTTILHSMGAGVPDIIGQGLAPLYVDATHVIRVSPVGIVAADAGTNVVTVLAAHTTPYLMSITLRSPDRTLIALPGTSAKSLLIYKVGPTSALQVATVTIATRATSFALGNDTLYLVSTTAKGTQISKQGFTDAKSTVIASLPSDLKITRFIIGSL